jgi:O-antigen/teichoic acid export membrane protein
MLGWHAFLYVASRIIAAALNFASVAIFARLAGPADYGAYLLTFAWAYIVYGFSVQWLRYAFFAAYHTSTADTQIATFTRTAGHLLFAALACALLTGALGLVPWESIVAVMALVVGLSAFDISCEVARTRLQAKAVAQASILRAVLSLSLGTAALLIYESPVMLALAVGAAHIGATVPFLHDLLPRIRAPGSMSTAKGFLRYGWPLIFAFGISALGQSVDRLLLASFSGLGIVGPYGAVADMVRQCMVVFGEAIAGAYVSIAKAAHANGDEARARDVLTKAFAAYATIALFGGAFIIRFEAQAIGLLLGPAFREPTEQLVPLFVAASAMLMFRSFYFGQVIYFARSSRLELIAALVTVATVGLLSLLLIPVHGAVGAAWALLLGQTAACVLYVWEGRRHYAMPLPLAVLARLAAYAVAGYGLTIAVEWMHLPLWPTLALQFAILCVAFLAASRSELLEFYRGAQLFRGRLFMTRSREEVAL